MTQYGIVKLEYAGDFFNRIMAALNVHHDVMRFVNLVDGMSQLTPTPVFGAMNGTARFRHYALVAFHHGRDLFALVRMNQKYDLVMSHCLPLWLKSARQPVGLQLPGIRR